MKQDLINKHKYYNNKFFGKWASLYDFEKYISLPLRQKAARFINLKPLKKLLDVATGTGAQAYRFAKLGHDVIGIDLSSEMLKQAKKKISPELKLRFQQEDATNLPFRDGSFDASSISLALHDMPYEIEIMVLKEMKRVTKKGSPILIVDYNEPKKHFIAKFSHQLIRLYETPMYEPFIKRGLENLLKEISLKIYNRTDFLGVIQINLIRNEK